MDWVIRMNEAVAVIEAGLTGQIDYDRAAQAACCSPWHFQRMFAYLAGMPLGEYVRRRRLSLAAMELAGGSTAIVDLAVKYGYDSREAFTRAFRMLFGISPSAARAGTGLKAYPPMAFHITIKGGTEMNYRICELEAFSAVGVTHRVNTATAFQEIPALWKGFMAEDLFGRLWAMKSPGEPFGGVLGLLAGGNFGKNEQFDYTLAAVSSENPPEGMVRFDFPKSLWVVFTAEGEPMALQGLWDQLYTQWVPAMDAVYDMAWLPSIECYLPPEAGKNELWIPIVKKQG